jgi:hypothetical protein
LTKASNNPGTQAFQFWKVQSQSHSNATLSSREQQQKHSSPRISTDEGLEISARQQESNADSSIRESWDSDSNVNVESSAQESNAQSPIRKSRAPNSTATVESFEHLRKEASPMISMNAGKRIDTIDRVQHTHGRGHGLPRHSSRMSVWPGTPCP